MGGDDDDDDNGERFTYRPNSIDDLGRGRRRQFRRGETSGQGREGVTGGDNVMWRRQKREGSHERGDAMMAKRFRGKNLQRGGSDTEVERKGGNDGERGAGREVRGERDGTRGGPFRQRHVRQHDGQRGVRSRSRRQRGDHADQNAARSRREDYRTQENTR